VDILPQLIVSGLALGSLYALVALGFVIQFRATGTLNFAHGAFLVLGAYFTSRLVVDGGLPFWAGALIAVTGMIALGMLLERVLVRPMIGRGIFVLGIMTLGVDLIIATLMQRAINDRVLPMGDPWGSTIVHFTDNVSLPASRVAAVVVAVALGAAFFAWFKFSSWGVAMRAAAEDSPTAALMGIRLGRVSSVAWGISGGLAAVAGVFLSTFPAAGVDPSLRTVAFAAFPAIALGGFDSTTGAIVGGMIIGLATQITLGYEIDLDFLGRGLSSVVPYIVLLVVLIWRPDGLFGTREIHRV
jgi:branched-chain amino acid transport system permease protein